MLLMAHELERTGTLAYQGGFWDDFALTVSNSVSSGATSLSASIPSTQDVYEFFSSLVSNPADNVSVPPKPADSSVSDASMETMECDPKQQGQPNIDWRSMPLKGYVNLPSVLQPFLNLPYLDHYLIIGRPTMAPSCGLAKYREVTPKADRAAAPFLIVIDKPGMLKDWKDDKYIWVEFNLGDVFMLDVSKMKKMADYVATLSKKGKWNFKDRQKK